jgi:O-antigen/teichoic acid export membrane protein
LGAFARTLRFTMKYLFVLTAPLVVITVLLAQPIVVLLYREGFAPSALALQVLGGALIFNFWNFAADCVLIAGNRERLLLRLTWSAAIIHVAANLILVPGLSYLGASLAVLGTQGLYFLILFSVVLRRYFNYRQLLKLITAPVLAALLMAGAILLLRGQNLFLIMFAGITVYVGALLALKGVTRAEINQLQNMAASDSHVR